MTEICGSAGRLPTFVNDAFLLKLKPRWDSLQLKARWDALNQQVMAIWHSLARFIVNSKKRIVLYILLVGLALFLALCLTTSPTVRTWKNVFVYSRWVRDETSWAPLATRAAEWETHFQDLQVQVKGENWAGLLRLRKHRIGAMTWDEKAEDYFYSRLERTQFPDDCSQAHLIAHYDHNSGLLSTLHVFQFPLFFALLRGHPVVPIRSTEHQKAFDGCGPRNSQHSMQCLFNVTICNPADDLSRLAKIIAPDRDQITWDEMLMQEDDLFAPRGTTVVETLKFPPWDDSVYLASSNFASYLEAFTYHKLALWKEMGRHGKAEVVTGSNKTCTDLPGDLRVRRVDMVVTALMSSWMLSRTPTTVKTFAEKIMSRYTGEGGTPLYQSPVLAIHIRQTDKTWEDPYYREHNRYRPVEDYVTRMKEMENEFGFKFPTIYVVSDSGTAVDGFIRALNGNDSAPSEDRRFVMYDWDLGDQSVEDYKDHNHVPKGVKHDMQIHFLASLYIVEKLADHAMVTYSSNVGRFIAEILAAKHRMAHVHSIGPISTSLDDHWFWY